MEEVNARIIDLLEEIRDLLVPVSETFRRQYEELIRKRAEEEFEQFRQALTPVRAKVYQLLFDARSLTQAEIAEKAGTTQPTVSRFVSLLMDRGWIEENESGEVPYRDKYSFREKLKEEDEHGGK